MDRKTAVHIAMLMVASGLTFVWTANPILNPYSLQLTGMMMLLFIFCRHILKIERLKVMESLIVTVSVFLITDSTGGISSPLFFLNYLLLFIVSLLLEPILPVVLSFTAILFYLFSSLPESPVQWTILLAFPTMMPLAYTLGQLYQKIKNQKQEIKNLSIKVETLEGESRENEMEHIQA